MLGESASGAAGFRMIVPVAEKARLLARLLEAGCVEASAEDVRVVRLENGKPRYGQEFSEAHLAQETGLLRALHFNKGCYLGQEIVERVRSRGHVNKMLTPLRVAGGAASEAGTKVLAGGKEAGEMVTAAFSPALECVVGFAYLRPEFARAGADLSVAGRGGAGRPARLARP